MSFAGVRDVAEEIRLCPTLGFGGERVARISATSAADRQVPCHQVAQYLGGLQAIGAVCTEPRVRCRLTLFHDREGYAMELAEPVAHAYR